MVKRVINWWHYTREALGVMGEMVQGLITEPECEAQINQLRRKYGLKDSE